MRAEADSSPPELPDHPLSPDDLARAIEKIKKRLAPRVQGDLAYSLVPDQVHRAFGEALCERGHSLHLVVPGEKSLCLSGDLGVICSKAVTLNVPPVRGDSSDHWVDCHGWLESVADIRIQIGRVLIRPESPKKPTVSMDPFTGTSEFSGFPKDDLLTDVEFEKTARYLHARSGTTTKLDEVKILASAVAKKSGPLFRFLQTGSLFLNLIPSFILALGAMLLWLPDTVALWRFGAATAAAFFAIGLRRVATRRQWLAARAVAEICRSLLASNRILNPLFPPSSRFLPRYATLARSLAIQHFQTHPPDPFAPLAFRDLYSQQRIGGQIEYYGDQSRVAKQRLRWIRGIFLVFTALSTVASTLALFSHLDLLPWLTQEMDKRWLSGSAALAFPSIAAAAIGYLGVTESARRAEYFADLADLLTKRKSLLDRLESESAITEAVRETEGILLEEVAGWLRRQVF
jgi:hypothetical protein